jgi:undecaprenyl-diphosphatase
MIDQLEHLDQQLFLFLNSLNSSLLDPVMYALSGKLIWVPLYIAILVFMFLSLKDRKKFYLLLLFIVLSVLITDQGSVLIKNIVRRPRPCHEPLLDGLVHIVNGKCGGMFGFISSHAANAFNVALISLLIIRRRGYTIFIIVWAAVVGYSRIYLGVHYPGDVLAGSVYGTIVGWGVIELYRYTQVRIENKNRNTQRVKQ